MKFIYLKQSKEDITKLMNLSLDESNTMGEEILITPTPSGTSISTNPHFAVLKELPREIDDQGKEKLVSLAGYVETAGKPGKQVKVKDNSNPIASLYGCVPVIREMPKNGRVVGYIKLKDSENYIALFKQKTQVPVIPVIVSVAALAVIAVLISSPNTKSPISLDKFTQGNLGKGEIELEKTEMQEAQNIRIIMNVNPVLEDGSMNLMIQNSEESNTLSMVAEVQLIDKQDQEGNIIESYEKPLVIAETPLIRPGENIENVPLSNDVQVEAGRYDGRVLYTAYEITEEGAMPIGQVAGRITLIVK